VIATEAGTFPGELILLEASEAGTYYTLEVFTKDGSWYAFFQFHKESEFLTGRVVAEMGDREARDSGAAGLVGEDGLVKGSKGTATVTLSPGRASIELDGADPDAKGRVDGPLAIDCYIPDPNRNPKDTAILLKLDEKFESEFCEQLKKFLPPKR
jgi:hypothetical protein